MSLLILEFVELEDFVAELRERGMKSVRIDIESVSGEPRGEFHNAPHTATAVVTALVTVNERHSAIVRWERTLLVTDSISLRMEREQSREKMFANFEKAKAELTALGFAVARGQWKTS